MNLKQKLSLFSALSLPALALSAYFLLTPARAAAQSCPGGMYHAPCGFNGTGCETGTGGCISNGARGYFIYCPPHPGAGSCSNGWTCCTQ